MEYFVKAKIERLPLSHGQYIDVKRRLNVGEQHELFARMSPQFNPGEKPQIQTQIVMTARVLAYLLGWSFTDEGEPVPYSPQMSDSDRLALINSLDPDVFAEIRDAINAHEQKIDAEIEAEKNGQGGAIGSSPSLKSVASSDGSMETLINSIPTSTLSS